MIKFDVSEINVLAPLLSKVDEVFCLSFVDAATFDDFFAVFVIGV